MHRTTTPTVPRPLLVALSLLAALGLSSCGGGGVDGAILRFQFLDVRASAIDSVRVTITAQPGQSFAAQPTETIDGVTVEVASDGALVLTLTRDAALARITQTDDAGLRPRLDLEVWSDDESTDPAPLVRVMVSQGSELIAQGSGYVAAWPLALGSISTIQVQCNRGSAAQCVRD